MGYRTLQCVSNVSSASVVTLAGTSSPCLRQYISRHARNFFS